MNLRLNLGAGSDVLDGWVNVDRDPKVDGVLYGDMRQLRPPSWGVSVDDGEAELVLVNHALHAVTYADAELVLDEVARVLAPGGRLVVIDADVYGVLHFGPEDVRRVDQVAALISDETEGTWSGKLLRWASWFSERRSLWSAPMLSERCERRGLDDVTGETMMATSGEIHEWLGARRPESFVYVGRKS